jgi:hypothetical protein
MRFKPEQHLEVARRLRELSLAEHDPRKATKQKALAEVRRRRALKSAAPRLISGIIDADPVRHPRNLGESFD